MLLESYHINKSAKIEEKMPNDLEVEDEGPPILICVESNAQDMHIWCEFGQIGFNLRVVAKHLHTKYEANPASSFRENVQKPIDQSGAGITREIDGP